MTFSTLKKYSAVKTTLGFMESRPIATQTLGIGQIIKASYQEKFQMAWLMSPKNLTGALKLYCFSSRIQESIEANSLPLLETILNYLRFIY